MIIYAICKCNIYGMIIILMQKMFLLSNYSMSSKSSKTFRLSFIRRRINSTFRSRALRQALLAELNGGEDAALVVQMIERVRPVSRLPTQVVTPMPQQNGEETVAQGAQVRPAEPTPQAIVRPQPRQTAPSDGLTANSAVEISDSESEEELVNRD